MKKFVIYLTFFALCISRLYAQETNEEFQTFLNKFPAGPDAFNMEELKGHEGLFPESQNFLPFDDKTEAGFWVSIGRWELNEKVVVLAQRYFFMPLKELAPYDEAWLVSYDKTGKILDYSMIGKGGDWYRYKLKGSMSPKLDLLVYRATIFPYAQEVLDVYPCLINISKLSMRTSGNISEQFVWNTRGTCTYKDTNTYLEIEKAPNINWLLNK